MCGILGIIDFSSPGNWDVRRFSDCLELQRHRGPDDSGVYDSPDFILGHRRLSILDLDSRSAQPMISCDGSKFLVFNGEIYNFRELKERLIQQGLKFVTESDTEVLLQGIIHRGIDFIYDCIGMFAFCYLDAEKKEAFLVRDRLGIKPLYYSRDRNRVTFSSTTGSLHALRPGSDFSPEALSAYLSFRYPTGDRTFFSDINCLEPGEYLRITVSTVEKKVYWDPARFIDEQKTDRGEEYYLGQLKELIESSVTYRLVSDVPVGAYLSGGVDSSGLVAAMATGSAEPINTFTIGFNSKGFNEFEYAREVAEQYGTNHHEIEQSSEDYFSSMRELIGYKGAPLAVPNEVPIWKLSRRLKDYITVVLSGEGADELFMGYGRIFRSAYDYERLGSQYEWHSETNRDAYLRNAKKKYGTIDFSNEIEHFLNLYSYTSIGVKKQLLSPDLPLESYEENFRREFQEGFDAVGNTSYENRISYTFIKKHLPGLLLRLDNATMAASVEGRVPFIDHRIVEFALTVPLKYKLKWRGDCAKEDYERLTSDQISEVHDTPKYLLKRAYEGRLSNSILYRKKMAFPVPLQEWFNGRFREAAHDILLSTSARNRSIYNTATIERNLSSSKIAENHATAMSIWMLMNTEMFIQSFFDG